MNNWFLKILKATIKGAAHGGSAYLGLLVAHNVTPTIPMLDFQSLGVVLLTSALVSFFTAVEADPLPGEEAAPPPQAPISNTTGVTGNTPMFPPVSNQQTK